MLTHRKNWCRVCGICLTCPRTSKSVFQQGDCHCTEKQANHVNPSKVKGEMLFSFRYRHLSAEDIDILEELRPHFKFITPPIERNLVRANICSTCQQRLRRARISRRRKHLTSAQLNIASPAKNSNASSSENEEEKEEDALTVGFGQHRIFLPAARPHSAIRSTLPSTSEVATWLTRAQLRAQHQPQRTLKPAAAEAVDLRGSASRLFIDEPGSQLNAAAPLSVPVHPHRISHSPIGSKKLRGHPPNTLALNASYRQMCTPPNMSAFCKENSPDRHSVESPDEEMDETRVELEEYSAAHSRHVKLPPILGSQQIQPPLPLLPPPHAILPVNRVQLTSRNHKLYSMEPNIEFRDASNAVLFRETISGDYPLEDIFNQYYPDSPRSLLFYIQDKIALPKKSTLNGILNQYNFQSLPVVVWAKVPVVANPNHTPQW